MRLLFAIYIVLHSCAAFSLEVVESEPIQHITPISIDLNPDVFQHNFQLPYSKVALATTYQSNLSASTLANTPINLTHNNFYFYGQLTLHKTSNFNLTMTANFNAIVDEETNLTHQPLSQQQYKTKLQQANHYGLMGSYYFSSSWQVTGGIIQSVPTTNVNTHQDETIDNIALIGATYSF